MAPRKTPAAAASADTPPPPPPTGRPRRAASMVAAAAISMAAATPSTTTAAATTKRGTKRKAADADDSASGTAVAVAAPAPSPVDATTTTTNGGRGKRGKKDTAAPAAPAAVTAATPTAPAADAAAVTVTTGRGKRGKKDTAATPAASTASAAPAPTPTVPAPVPDSSTTTTKKTVVLKGRAPVDELCHIKDRVHVYSEGTVVYDVMLNQTDVSFNVKGHNKYYVIQLLESDSGSEYYCWQRWGRVGHAGQSALKGPTSLGSAKAEFTSKFRDKTSNNFSDGATFSHQPGKYDLVVLDYEASKDDMTAASAATTAAKPGEPAKPTPDSKLDKRVQSLMKLIFDVKAMEEAVLEMNYDTKKAPLGKLSKDQVKAGYEALKEIEEYYVGRHAINEANNKFYTKIPHDFGFSRPPVINTLEKVKEKVKLLEALGEIEIAMKALKTSTDTSNPIDRHYETLHCDLAPLDRSHANWGIIDEYIRNTHAKTHSNYTLSLEDVYVVGRQGEDDRFKKTVDNRQLLWHGSRLTNFVGILSQGLRIAPPEAPSTGYMFGKGVYFADMVSKSANYCFTNRTNNTGLLLLCEVALGKCNELQRADFNASKLPAGCSSTKGLGKTIPDPSHATTIDDGNTKVPYGTCVQSKQPEALSSVLQYNEYIVYDISQVRMRYLLRVKFNYV